MRQKIGISNFAAVAVLALLFTGCSSRGNNGEKAIKVQTSIVQAANEHRIIEFPGRVKAADQVDLAFKVSGTIMKFYVDEGDFVKEGTLLVEMDPKDYKLQYDAAKAEYNSVKAQAGRVMALYADSVATPDNYDKARYGLEQITAKYENAKNQLSYTRIYAPYDCYIQKRLADVSSVTGAGMPVLAVISSSLPEVDINIPGAEYLHRDDFRAFSARFDFLDRVYDLSMLSISPDANANQLYRVRLRFKGGYDRYPSPGMNTMVTIKCRERDSVYTTIPSTALFAEEGNSMVWIVRPDSTISKRSVDVETLLLNGNALISKGLTEGETVVTAGVSKLHNNQKVENMGMPSKTNVGGLL